MHQFPAHLRLIEGCPTMDGGPRVTLFRQRAAENGVAVRPARQLGSHQGLLERLDCVGTLGPGAPLSFIVVHVAGIDLLGADAEERGHAALEATARRIHELTRPIDFVGLLARSSFGVVLQGTAATAAAAVAARLEHHLERLAEIEAPLTVRVSVATGTGVNADTLPVAALDALLGTPA